MNRLITITALLMSFCRPLLAEDLKSFIPADAPEGSMCYDGSVVGKLNEHAKKRADCLVENKRLKDKLKTAEANAIRFKSVAEDCADDCRVEVSTPKKFYQERWFQITVVGLLGFGLGIGIGAAL